MGFASFFCKWLLIDAVIILLVLYLPNLPPDAEFTRSERLPKPRRLEGPLALNEKLKDVEFLHKGKFSGSESFADFNGELYTGLNGGSIVKFVGDKIVPVAKTGKTCKGYYEEHICGRPLGMQFDKNGNLVVADAYYGILKVDVKTGKKEVLVSPDTKFDGKKALLFNSVALASNGDIYWTTSSSKFPLHDLLFDALADGSGRLIHYDAKTKTNRVLIENIEFANGVALSENEDFVIVAESLRGRIHRYYLKGPKKGTHDIFIDALPGLVDNIKKDGRGGFLVPLIENHDEENPSLMVTLAPFPLVRKFICRVLGLSQLAFETLDRYYPNEFAQKAVYSIGSFSSMAGKFPVKRTTVLRISNSGEILESFHTTNTTDIYMFSEAYIFKDHMYLGSPLNDFTGRVSLDAIGWTKSKASVVEPKVEAKKVPKQEGSPQIKTTTTAAPPKQTTTTAAPPKHTTTTKPPTTQAPKTQPPKTQPTQAPKPQTTQTPKPQTTQTPKTQTTQAPKPQTTQKPKPQTTESPKTQPTKAPKQQTTQAPTTQPTQAPKKDNKPQPKKETVASQQTTPTPQKAPPTKQQAQPPKQQTPPVETRKSEGSKAVPLKEPKVKN